ncbi:hypothetical protein AX17_007336 [Amanita inopinata Kibby_2008]|nr:hypothetical protein AX17_007336 [Amanita inopinata Kibby_2008]
MSDEKCKYSSLSFDLLFTRPTTAVPLEIGGSTARGLSEDNKDTDKVGDASEGSTQSKPRLLTLRLVTKAEQESERYAVVPFPATYQDAKVLAIETLGDYMSESTPDDIILRRSAKNREGTWIWADLRPDDWKIVMEDSAEEVGVFSRDQRDTVSEYVSEYEFVRGEVSVTYGQTNGHTTTWSYVGLTACIDRPKSYQEAVAFIKNMLLRTPMSISDLRDVNLDNKEFTFYSFVSTRGGKPTTDWWQAIPSLTQFNDNAWRVFVPKTGQILGFKIN